MSDNALSFSPTKWSIIGAAFSNGHENQEKNQDCGNRPICCGCHRHHRENSEWVVFSDKTWWHAFCAAEELFRQLAQRDERNAALEARALRMEKALGVSLDALDDVEYANSSTLTDMCPWCYSDVWEWSPQHNHSVLLHKDGCKRQSAMTLARKALEE